MNYIERKQAKEKVEDLQTKVDQTILHRQWAGVHWYDCLTTEQKQTLNRAMVKANIDTPATMESLVAVLATVATTYEHMMEERVKAALGELQREALDLWRPGR